MAIRIANVVFDAPGSTLDEYATAAGGIAALYAELLDMRLLSRGDHYRSLDYPADAGDDADPLVRAEDPDRPNIAFECETGGYRAPAWPDPSRPAQVHLDLSVPDLDVADRVATRHGARLLLDAGDHRVYADLVGHPFCVAGDAAVGGRGRIARIVFDCFSPRSLAAFWGGLLDLPVTVVDSPERVELRGPAGDGRPTLAFQHTVGPAPRWPDPAFPQQLHLDLGAGDDEAAHALALRLGAVRLPYLGGGFVFADPAGHPFCLGE